MQLSLEKLGYQVFHLKLLSCLLAHPSCDFLCCLSCHSISRPAVYCCCASWDNATWDCASIEHIDFISILIRLLKNVNILLNSQRANHVAWFQYKTWLVGIYILQINTITKNKTPINELNSYQCSSCQKRNNYLNRNNLQQQLGIKTWTHQGLDGLQITHQAPILPAKAWNWDKLIAATWAKTDERVCSDKSQFPPCYTDTRVKIRRKQQKSTDPSCVLSWCCQCNDARNSWQKLAP